MNTQLRDLLKFSQLHQEPLYFIPQRLQEEYDAVRSKYEEGDLRQPKDLSKFVRQVKEEVINGYKTVDEVLTKNEQRLVPLMAFQGAPPFIENDRFFKFSRNQIKNSHKSTILSGWLHYILKNKKMNSSNLKHLA